MAASRTRRRFDAFADELIDHSIIAGFAAPTKRKEENMCTTTTQSIPVGSQLPDGTVFAGISPCSGRPMYAALKDAPMRCDFTQAVEHAAALAAHGHRDWRVPSKDELHVLFQNRTAIGGFDEGPGSWYWSRDRVSGGVWSERFHDGYQSFFAACTGGALRCVRLG